MRPHLERLILDNLDFADWTARRWWRRGGPAKADLVQAARLGLVQAARTFEPARGFKFISWAVYSIRSRLQEESARIPPPALSISPTDAHEEDAAPLTAVNARPGPLQVNIRRQQVQEARRVAALLDGLPAREARVLRMRHGIETGEEMTLQAIGDRLDLSKEMVRRIEKAALLRLRLRIHER